MNDNNPPSENCRVCWYSFAQDNDDVDVETMYVFDTLNEIPIVDAIEDISNIKVSRMFLCSNFLILKLKFTVHQVR
jgi:hypothetical protein